MTGGDARVLVSIHDVTPALAPGVERLWDACAERGVRPALLVVPDWHGAWPLERHPRFVAWVRDRVREGADVLLHGLRHDEHNLPRRWTDAARAAGRTAREGEFLTLDRAGALARIREGVARLRALGLEPLGFVPPAWLARAGCLRAVADAGLALTEDAGAVYTVRPNAPPLRLASPALRWSARDATRALASAAVAEWRWRALRARRAPLVRVALHPSDLDRATTARSSARALARWADAALPMTYRALAAAGAAH